MARKQAKTPLLCGNSRKEFSCILPISDFSFGGLFKVSNICSRCFQTSDKQLSLFKQVCKDRSMFISKHNRYQPSAKQTVHSAESCSTKYTLRDQRIEKATWNSDMKTCTPTLATFLLWSLLSRKNLKSYQWTESYWALYENILMFIMLSLSGFWAHLPVARCFDLLCMPRVWMYHPRTKTTSVKFYRVVIFVLTEKVDNCFKDRNSEAIWKGSF